MSGRLGMTGDSVVRGDKEFGKIAATRKPERSDYSGAAVGTGTALAAGGLVGGGVPGARPDSGRLAHIPKGSKTEATRHLVSATRGGIFGYREDAHRSFLNRANKDLRGWRVPHGDTGNAFERGMTQGKAHPEKTIVRQLHRARTGSNVVLGGGLALAAGGVLANRRGQPNRKRPIRKRDKDYKSNALIAGGATAALGGGIGGEVLEHQGNKWTRQAAHHLREAQKINPNLGGYERQTTRQRKLLGPTHANVPDMQAHRSTAHIVGDAWDTQRGQSHAQATAAGKHRGAATQSRYFARVYGRQARVARRAGAGGALIAGLGITGRHFEVKRKPVKKSYIPGVGYKAATAIPRGELRSLAHGGRKAKMGELRAHNRAESEKWKGVNDAIAGGHAHFDDQRGFNPNRLVKKPNIGRASHFQTTVMHNLSGQRKELLGDATATAMAHGGRRGGRMVISAPDAPDYVLRHEASHVQPKRSAYRMHTMNPLQLAREEARADMASGNPATHYKSSLRSQMKGGASMYSMSAKSKIFRRLANRSQSEDPQYKAMFSNEGAKAYRDVQDRIAGSRRVGKAATLTMSDSDAHRLAQRYDTRGPLPKKLSRDQKMKAYEARYIASGGRKAEKWKHRANAAEVGRNIGLAGATGGALLTLAARGKKLGPKLARAKITSHSADNATIGSAAFGGASELYGEHARSRRASYQNSPAGVAGSALSRMQAYTPEKKP